MVTNGKSPDEELIGQKCKSECPLFLQEQLRINVPGTKGNLLQSLASGEDEIIGKMSSAWMRSEKTRSRFVVQPNGRHGKTSFRLGSVSPIKSVQERVIPVE